MSAFNWSAIAFILAAIGLVVFMLVVPRLLGGRSQGSQKEEVFEAGVVGSGNARIRLSAKFYLVAIFFVIFDLEALYLYAYAVSVREAGWLGFAAAGTFITILIIGLIYELSLGAMNWAPADKLRKKARLYAAPAGFNLADITKFDGAHELMVDPTGKVPAQSSGQINVSNNIEINRRHLQNIDHINTTGNVTSVDFATSAQQDKTER
ncbi:MULTISPECIES: NADH-quinone oxidoreductase subunit A [unclassified Psychrobacter]|uniref:NADH-quinone oxidoreductase subunit A n=1 Tax=unclassified Psychrobacter TaxID=196806 RepID=UPI00086E3B29|nr:MULTISPECIES: NADH-quinone oxidoreductase subunit A [unclassified Psychrobacter]MBA6245070.1 NADH-quinone oxidoreductase subunit A [Psychrobacter sp. Urea-trap-18]MBA6286673.1 NADH-quinone oxidoreductase subunit A [Psychrobacter sp. Urea-trap-16]MBA6317868.1 NADH-quinone oxidoreductase subunit A [Psychrobacter sp. Urea-trap-20]MBA6334397.1 NADH-quinone oxidoreductase subunit A [Psychrobacter sp. Urea-trap-19]OEH68420.1 MAG: NADH-quinone oxidoreductase subunit A [Psychrobacter sp. B29-1]|tara:strand:+ start:3598 stop:4221 length:624 start_codon:yes stop_codon:yes gene_type:complete